MTLAFPPHPAGDGRAPYPRPLGVHGAPHVGDVPDQRPGGGPERRHPEADLLNVSEDPMLEEMPADVHLDRARVLITAAAYMSGEQRRNTVQAACQRIAYALRAVGEQRFTDVTEPADTGNPERAEPGD
ncbi:MAG: hypothetical protein ABJA80_01965 [bacterium]